MTVTPCQVNPFWKSSERSSLQWYSAATDNIRASQIGIWWSTVRSNAVWKANQVESATRKLSAHSNTVSRTCELFRLSVPKMDYATSCRMTVEVMISFFRISVGFILTSLIAKISNPTKYPRIFCSNEPIPEISGPVPAEIDFLLFSDFLPRLQATARPVLHPHIAIQKCSQIFLSGRTFLLNKCRNSGNLVANPAVHVAAVCCARRCIKMSIHVRARTYL